MDNQILNEVENEEKNQQKEQETNPQPQQQLKEEKPELDNKLDDKKETPQKSKEEILKVIETVLSQKLVTADIKKKYDGIEMKSKDPNINKAFSLLMNCIMKFEDVLYTLDKENKEYQEFFKDVPAAFKNWGDFVTRNDNQKPIMINQELALIIKKFRDILTLANQLYSKGDIQGSNNMIDELIKEYPGATDTLNKYKHNDNGGK